jgi:NADP-dependent 3-hydroxy acid dehydrogenase YdfG
MSKEPGAVLITGCSSGIGHETARHLAANGWKVYATARRPESIADLADGCETLALDVTDEASMKAAVDAVEAAEGRVGALVNNAGYSQSGAVESLSMDKIRAQFETNVFGLVRMCQLVLPKMREAGRGRIVNVSSMGGKLVFPGGGAYHATKFRGRGVLRRAALGGPRLRRPGLDHRARPDHHPLRGDRRRLDLRRWRG